MFVDNAKRGRLFIKKEVEAEPFINSKGWEYEIYHDPNSDFKRALGINQIPHTFLLNGKNEIISEHVGYTDGQEEELYGKIKKLIK